MESKGWTLFRKKKKVLSSKIIAQVKMKWSGNGRGIHPQNVNYGTIDNIEMIPQNVEIKVSSKGT